MKAAALITWFLEGVCLAVFRGSSLPTRPLVEPAGDAIPLEHFDGAVRRVDEEADSTSWAREFVDDTHSQSMLDSAARIHDGSG